LDLGRDLHRDVDEHAVLERRREHGLVLERLPSPADGFRRRLALEVGGDRRELREVRDERRVWELVVLRGVRRDGGAEVTRPRANGYGRGGSGSGERARHVAHSLSPTSAT